MVDRVPAPAYLLPASPQATGLPMLAAAQNQANRPVSMPDAGAHVGASAHLLAAAH